MKIIWRKSDGKLINCNDEQLDTMLATDKYTIEKPVKKKKAKKTIKKTKAPKKTEKKVEKTNKPKKLNKNL